MATETSRKFKKIKKYIKENYPEDTYSYPQAFDRFILKIFFNQEEVENEADETLRNLGSHDKGIDGFFENDETQEMVFCQFKSTTSVSPSDDRSQEISSFFAVINHINYLTAASNKRVQEIASIYQEHREEYSTSMHFFCNEEISNPPIPDKDKNSYYVHGIDSIYDKFQEFIASENENKPTCAKLEFFPTISKEQKTVPCYKPNKHNETTIGIVSGQALSELYIRHGHGLFASNLRYYLGSNKVNKAIKATIEQEKERSKFYYYNNGVTMICTRQDKKGLTLTLTNPQIVNGAQTVTTLGKYKPKTHLEDILVATRIIVIDSKDKKLMSKITESNNSQTLIDAADQKANDPRQKAIHNQLKEYGYFYEYKRGLWNKTDSKDKSKYKKIVMRSIAAPLYSFICGTLKATTNKKNIFQDDRVYNTLFPDEPNNEYIQSFVLTHKIFEVLKDIKNPYNKILDKDSDTTTLTDSEKEILKQLLGEPLVTDLLTNESKHETAYKTLNEYSAVTRPTFILAVMHMLLEAKVLSMDKLALQSNDFAKNIYKMTGIIAISLLHPVFEKWRDNKISYTWQKFGQHSDNDEMLTSKIDSLKYSPTDHIIRTIKEIFKDT